MFIKKISLNEYKVLKDLSINFEYNKNHNIFPIISYNGGGKSTFLQVVFTFLHCAFKQNRQKYLSNLLLNQLKPVDKNNLSKIIEFELLDNDELVKIDFYYCKNDYKKLNFNSILELRELKTKRAKLNDSIKEIEFLNNLEIDLSNSEVQPSLVWRELKQYIKSSREEESLRRGNTENLLNFIAKTKNGLEKTIAKDDELNTLVIIAEAEKSILTEELNKNGLSYAFHFNNNNNVLLYKSNVNNEKLNSISDKIYLATPNSQVLHFLDDSQISSLFSSEKYIYSSYEYYLKECQKDVSGLFNYDFSSINLILDAFQKARDNDFKVAIETGEYGSQIKNTREELNKLLIGKSIIIDNDFKGVTFKTVNSQISLNPKDLSHGELKKLSIYIWLKTKTADNSIVLMDEIDMGLHPTWQHEISNDLQSWTIGNQFILATHSPQIISKAHYKNLVVLKNINNRTTAEQFDEAPLESDLNTIVKTIMGGDYIPVELAELRKKYRLLFEKKLLESKDAINIKNEILTYESENSSFFQEIKFQQLLGK